MSAAKKTVKKVAKKVVPKRVAKKAVKTAAKKAVKKTARKRSKKKAPGAPKELASPFSTGGGGIHFEENIQASFVVLMLCGGYAPALSTWAPIEKIKLQAKHVVIETDDLVVYTKDPVSSKQRKLHGQVKHSLAFTKANETFKEVLAAAWLDYKADTFDRSRFGDVIALITGPLSGADIAAVRPLLERARTVENAEEYIKDIELGNFTSDATRIKFSVFKAHLKKANKGKALSDTELHGFMRSFYWLIYDLDIKSGVHEALVRTILSCRTSTGFESLWERIQREVRECNQTAGTISKDSFPEEFLSMFVPSAQFKQPQDLPVEPIQEVATPELTAEEIALLSCALLAGEWNDSYEGDREVVEALSGRPYSEWLIAIKPLLEREEKFLAYRSNRWAVRDLELLWEKIASSIDDLQLERFEGIAVQVLSEIDSDVLRKSSERQELSFRQQQEKYSDTLQESVAKILNLISHKNEELKLCSIVRRSSLAKVVVRQVLAGGDGYIWGCRSLKLSELAEAAPGGFIQKLEEAIYSRPSSFLEIFANEDSGALGRNYMTGVLWALESLAWSPDYFMLSLLCLSQLAAMDPGGNWSNRPLNSATTILLPWFPQTLASSEERKAAVQAVCHESPEVGWELLLSLLPNAQSTSSGTHKQRYLTLPGEEEFKQQTNKTYWSEAQLYSDLAFKLATGDYDKLLRLLKDLEDLPSVVFDNMVEYLSSEEIVKLDEAKRFGIWDCLSTIALKHRKYADAEWSMHESYVSKVEAVAERLKPESIRSQYKRYFVNDEFNLYEGTGDWQAQRESLQNTRNEGVEKLLEEAGLESILAFRKEVESQRVLGYALGVVLPLGEEDQVLPEFLGRESLEDRQFIDGYVNARQTCKGWSWVDGIKFDVWSSDQIAEFFSNLPFVEEAWSRSEDALGGQSGLYWTEFYHHIPSASGKFDYALLQFHRYRNWLAAVETCFWMTHENVVFDWEIACDALDGAVSIDKSLYRRDHHNISEVIKALQDNPDVHPERIERVEWSYLQLIERAQSIRPIFLERKLSTDPNYFCEALRILYRPEGRPKPKEDPTEEERALASNAWHLFRVWRILPGTVEDGSFSAVAFNEWLRAVLDKCKESGHLEVAMLKIGEVLTYCPAESDESLWICRSAAAVLNGVGADAMRSGYHTEVFNSRGVVTVVPSGEPEFKLAKKWQDRAEAVRIAGYPRFAESLKTLSDSYEADGKRIRDRGSLFDD